MIALGRPARDVQVQVLVFAFVARDQFLDDGRPFRIAVRVGQLDTVQAVLQPLQVLGQAERAARLGAITLFPTRRFRRRYS